MTNGMHDTTYFYPFLLTTKASMGSTSDGPVSVIRGIRAVPSSCTPTEDDNNDRYNEERILSVFRDWTPETIAQAIRSEDLSARMYRKIAMLAGLVRPLNEADYRRALQSCGSDADKIRSKFIVANLKSITTGYQLNSRVLPFDTYQLFRESRRSFILLLVALYFVLSSVVVALLAWGANCLVLEVRIGNFVSMGFLILSGLGDSMLNRSESICLAIHSVAIFVGVYVSLPVIGAIVLVRLLDNKADLILCSDVLLLTVRNGVPEVTVRICSASGRMVRNFTLQGEVWFHSYDETNEDEYFEQHILEFRCTPYLAYYPAFAKHFCVDDSILIRKGAIVIDEYGVPNWNPSKVLFISITMDADGTRGSDRMFEYHPQIYIEPNERGQNPSFVPSCPVNHWHWLKHKGRVSPLNDISRLSAWEYKGKEPRPRKKGD